MAGRRTRGNRSILSIALGGPWWCAGAFGGGAALVRVMFDRELAGNLFAPLVLPLSDALLALLAWAFAALAGFKLLGVALRYALRPAPSSDNAPCAPRSGSSDITAQAPRPAQWSLAVLRDMEWKRFEELCTAFYQEHGIRAQATPLGPDGGVDIRLFQDADPSRCTAIVQCKAWGTRAVGVKEVRELRGVMADEHIDEAYFLAPGRYTPEAQTFAAANAISLVDGVEFLAALESLSPPARDRLLALATEGDWTTPSCPRCGAKMLPRRSARGSFWGCSHYPQCKQTLGMRRDG